MTTRPLPTSTPSARGVDAGALLAFLDATEAAPDIELHSLMVLRHGYVVAAGWWSPYSAERPHLLYSLSKSFTSTAAGLAVAEGLMGLDDPVISHFPEFASDITDPASRSMRVRHLAAMASGHVTDTWVRAQALDPVEPVRGFLLLPPDREPGTVFAYNQSATYTLAAIIQRAAGQSLTDYLRPRLFDPLGIGEVGWQQQPSGRDLGFTGLHATTDAIARLGQLYLQRGQWDGRELLPAEWVAEATRPHVPTPVEPAVDWRQGYGFQFWMARHGYRGDGAYGQFCLVLPEQEAVIAITAQNEDMQAVLDATWTHLLPAFGDSHGRTEAADTTLRERLSRLALPPVVAEPGPPVRAGAGVDTTFHPAGGECSDQPSLRAVEVTTEPSGWQVALIEREGTIRSPLGAGGWVSADSPSAGGGRQVPTAVSGGWADARTVRFAMIFLETPHRLEVTCDLASRTFRAHWVTVPIRVGRLLDLRSP